LGARNLARQELAGDAAVDLDESHPKRLDRSEGHRAPAEAVDQYFSAKGGIGRGELLRGLRPGENVMLVDLECQSVGAHAFVGELGRDEAGEFLVLQRLAGQIDGEPRNE